MIDRNDPRLTAFVLGELDSGEESQVRRAIEQSAELAQVVDDIRKTASQLADEFAADLRVGLSAEQKTELVEGKATPAAVGPAAKSFALKYWAWAAVAASLMALAIPYVVEQQHLKDSSLPGFVAVDSLDDPPVAVAGRLNEDSGAKSQGISTAFVEGEPVGERGRAPYSESARSDRWAEEAEVEEHGGVVIQNAVRALDDGLQRRGGEATSNVEQVPGFGGSAVRPQSREYAEDPPIVYPDATEWGPLSNRRPGTTERDLRIDQLEASLSERRRLGTAAEMERVRGLEREKTHSWRGVVPSLAFEPDVEQVRGIASQIERLSDGDVDFEEESLVELGRVDERKPHTFSIAGEGVRANRTKTWRRVKATPKHVSFNGG